MGHFSDVGKDTKNQLEIRNRELTYSQKNAWLYSFHSCAWIKSKLKEGICLSLGFYSSEAMSPHCKKILILLNMVYIFRLNKYFRYVILSYNHLYRLNSQNFTHVA